MTFVALSIYGGVGWQFFDNNGDPLSGGKIYTYAAGTTTPLQTYTSSSGATPHSNPIILDAAGKVPGGEIWVLYSSLYKFVVKTSTDVLLNTYDNLGSSYNASPGISNFTGDGVTTNFILAFVPASTDTTSVFINGVYQQKNTYSIASTTLTFSEAPPDTSTIEVVYV